MSAGVFTAHARAHCIPESCHFLHTLAGLGLSFAAGSIVLYVDRILVGILQSILMPTALQVIVLGRFPSKWCAAVLRDAACVALALSGRMAPLSHRFKMSCELDQLPQQAGQVRCTTERLHVNAV